MPPNQPPSSSLNDLDPLELLDNAVWDLAGQAALPPMAGGQLPTFLGDAYNWAKGNLLDPASDFLKDILAEIGRTVAGATTTILGWILKSAYQLLRFALWSGLPDVYHRFFPATIAEVTQSPWTYIRRILEMPVMWVYGRLIDVTHWLWARVEDAFEVVRGWLIGGWEWIAARVESWARWVKGEVWQISRWLAGVVWDAIEVVRGWLIGGWEWIAARVESWARWLSGEVWSQVQWVAGVVWDAIEVVRGWLIGGWEWIAARTWEAVTWVWSQVSAALRWAWDNVISKIPEGIVKGAAAIGQMIMDAFKWLVNSAFEPFVDVVNRKLAIPGKLLRAEYGSLEELLNDMLDPPEEMLKGWSGMIIFPFIVVGLLVQLITGLSGPLLEPVLQEQARNVGARIPPFALLREGYLRDLLPEDVHDDWLGRSGFDAANIELQKALYEEIPGPTDLVRMGVREVFTPEIAERFGQFEDLPPAFVEWMGKQGYTEEWARNFWGAHWDLPSVTQGFEMFHRGVIEEADLQLLLRALDVMPFWRDNLTEIAYRVITRVDVRRMYAEGVFSRDQVLRVYRDLGYKPQDAEDLTEFVVRRYPPKGSETADDLRSVTASTIKQALARRLITHDDALEGLQELDYSPDDAQLVLSIWEFDWTQDPSLRSDVDPKGLARGVIEKAYERRLIDLNGGVRELGELGYTPEDARLLLQLVDLRLDEQLADLEIDGLVGDYQDGVITDGQLAAALADLHVPAARVDFLLQREILGRQAKRRRLTLSQMKKALAEDLMDVREYRARLDVMGYNRRDVEILVSLNVESV